VLTQSLEKLYNLPANHRLLDAQGRLAAAQARQAERTELEATDSLNTGSEPEGPDSRARPRVIDPIPAAENRLRRARIRVTEIDLDVPDDL
jgi:hypothetical protein